MRMLIPLVAGILMATAIPGIPAVPLPVILFYCLPGVLFFSLMGAFFLLRVPSWRPLTSGGALLFFFFFLVGVTIGLQQENRGAGITGDRYMATLLEKPYFKNRSFRAEALLTGARAGDSHIATREKVMVYFSSAGAEEGLVAGSRILFAADPSEIVNRGNPGEFDYRGYAASKGIYRQVFLAGKPWQEAGRDPRFRLRVTAENTRDHLLGIYRESGLSGREYEILSALTLGYKKSMEGEIRQLFADTGASHVLAVSGLHTGIVYMIFSVLLGFLRKGKTSRYVFLVVAFAALWSFAFITGLAPSVQRSALMFSVVLAGENLRRPANTWNTLAASAFLLLFANPRLLADVGFQLSYAAVGGIVFFQPRIARLLSFRSRAARYLWELLAVSLASQITTFPLSCYYFHQFPLYFWISNFIVIPAAFVFIFLGILVLVTSVWLPLSMFLAGITGMLTTGVCFLLEKIASLPWAVLPGIGFPVTSLLLSYVTLVMIIFFLVTRKSFYLQGILLSATLLFMAGAILRFRQAGVREIIVYNSREPQIHLIHGRENYLLVSGEPANEGEVPPEAGAFIQSCRLKKPVVIPIGDDYGDALVLKRGNLFSFGGLLAGIVTGDSRWPGEVKPRLLIVTHEGSHPTEPAGDGWVVSTRNRGVKPGNPEIHYTASMGAWRHPLP